MDNKQPHKIKRALLGYSIKDVSKIIEMTKAQGNSRADEYKKRFEETMKLIDQKDERCTQLENRVTELQVMISEYESQIEVYRAGEENFAQLLEILESKQHEIDRLKADCSGNGGVISADRITIQTMSDETKNTILQAIRILERLIKSNK